MGSTSRVPRFRVWGLGLKMDGGLGVRVEDVWRKVRNYCLLIIDGLGDFSQVDKLGVRQKSVNFGARKSPGSPRLVKPNLFPHLVSGLGGDLGGAAVVEEAH